MLGAVRWAVNQANNREIKCIGRILEMNLIDSMNSKFSYMTYGLPSSPALLLMPSWYLLNNSHWKMLIDYLKIHFYVISFSPSNDQSIDHIEHVAIKNFEQIVDSAIILLDYLKIKQAHLVGFFSSCAYAISLARAHKECILSIALINNPYEFYLKSSYKPQSNILYQRYSLWKRWQYDNPSANSLTKGKMFFKIVLKELSHYPLNEHIIGCSKIVDIDFLEKTTNTSFALPAINSSLLTQSINCPVIQIQGELDPFFEFGIYDQICNKNNNIKYTIINDAAHMPHFFSPVKVNKLLYNFFINNFVCDVNSTSDSNKDKYKALYIPSPVGLGHVQRDLALANELRKKVDIDIEWLIPNGPARAVLEEKGEIINSHSSTLQSILHKMVESSNNHEMNFFGNWRKSESLRIANFMTFLKAVEETKFNLLIGDEAWEVDHYLHKNPKLKNAPFVFLTDFIGWLPIDNCCESDEAKITEEYNYEMIKMIEHNPKIRDKALYIGHYFDITKEKFGHNLPSIREWAKENFEEVGYLYSFDQKKYKDDCNLYYELGLEPGENFIIISVGGTIVGQSLLQKAIKAWQHVYKIMPNLHCVVVTGPSIKLDQTSFDIPNLVIKRYISDAHRYFAIADLGVVQGGLGTTMELSICKRPFLYFPLKGHCEQLYHVNHRLKMYNSGKCLAWDTTDDYSLAQQIIEGLSMDTSKYFHHDPDNLIKAADLILNTL